MNIFSLIFESLNEAEVDYLVVGGVAVNMHGYSRMTGDIDFVIALDEQNINKLDSVMKKLRFTPRQPIELKELKNDKRVRELIETKNMKAFTLLPPNNQLLQIDILAEESLEYNKYRQNRVLMKKGDLEIPVIALDDLIGMKRKANRERDLEDIEALMDIKGLS